MRHPFTLITTDGDNDMPTSTSHYITLLEHPLLLRWYTQNLAVSPNSTSDAHAKLRAIPIGFDLHTAYPERLPLLQMRGLKPREMALLVDTMAHSHRERLLAKRGVSCVQPVTTARISPVLIWKLYATYAFGLSPRGVGLDCHRTWEMLALGMIPVVKTSTLDVLYTNLPVLILTNWDEICSLNLTTVAKKLEPRWHNVDAALTMTHWVPEYKSLYNSHIY